MSGPCGKAIQLTIVMIAVFTLWVDQTDATKGCANYGHSCYGGHGKRFAPDAEAPDVAMIEPEEKQSYGNMRSLDRVDGDIRYAFSPLLRQWLENYRQLRQLENVVPNQNEMNY